MLHSRPMYGRLSSTSSLTYLDELGTLVNLSCTNRELCILLRRRVFSEVTFTISRNAQNTSHHLEPCWSAAPKLLKVLQSRPAIAECVKHLEIHVFISQTLTPSSRVWYYDDFSITRLVPYLKQFKTLSFVMSPHVGLVNWRFLPEDVRSAVHPLLHRVPDLRLKRLSGAFAASTRLGGISALESLTVSSCGTFEVGDSFSPMMRSGNTTPQALQPHRLKVLTIDMSRFLRFSDWLIVDNPAFPITVNHIEKLVCIGLQYQDTITPDHGFYRILSRCASGLKRLEILPTNRTTQNISVKASLENVESQRQTYSGRCPDLSSLTNLSFLAINGADISTYRHGKPQKNTNTSIPYIIKTLLTLPHYGDRQTHLQYLHLYFDIHEFKDYSLKQVDWTNFVECLLDNRFSNLNQVFLDITYVYDSSENSNYDRIERVRPPRFVTKVLEENQDLIKLKHKRGLVLGSTATKRYPGDYVYTLEK